MVSNLLCKTSFAPQQTNTYAIYLPKQSDLYRVYTMLMDLVKRNQARLRHINTVKCERPQLIQVSANKTTKYALIEVVSNTQTSALPNDKNEMFKTIYEQITYYYNTSEFCNTAPIPNIFVALFDVEDVSFTDLFADTKIRYLLDSVFGDTLSKDVFQYDLSERINQRCTMLDALTGLMLGAEYDEQYCQYVESTEHVFESYIKSSGPIQLTLTIKFKKSIFDINTNVTIYLSSLYTSTNRLSACYSTISGNTWLDTSYPIQRMLQTLFLFPNVERLQDLIVDNIESIILETNKGRKLVLDSRRIQKRTKTILSLIGSNMSVDKNGVLFVRSDKLQYHLHDITIYLSEQELDTLFPGLAKQVKTKHKTDKLIPVLVLRTYTPSSLFLYYFRYALLTHTVDGYYDLLLSPYIAYGMYKTALSLYGKARSISGRIGTNILSLHLVMPEQQIVEVVDIAAGHVDEPTYFESVLADRLKEQANVIFEVHPHWLYSIERIPALVSIESQRPLTDKNLAMILLQA